MGHNFAKLFVGADTDNHDFETQPQLMVRLFIVRGISPHHYPHCPCQSVSVDWSSTLSPRTRPTFSSHLPPRLPSPYYALFSEPFVESSPITSLRPSSPTQSFFPLNKPSLHVTWITVPSLTPLSSLNSSSVQLKLRDLSLPHQHQHPYLKPSLSLSFH